MGAIIRFENIDKHFGEVYANQNVTFDIEKGSVHAIVGENGAGKSTLMNILYGMLSPDSGTIYYDGMPVRIKNPKDAINLGIGMVHQHFMLVPSLTVMENITLGMPPHNAKIWKPESFRPEITKIMQDFGLFVDLDARVMNLSVGMKQRVEILKTLYRGARVIILDEPTAILTPQEAQELFETIRLLVHEDHTVIFISHKLKEIMEISDTITALRDGKVVNTVKKEQVTAKNVAYMMIGRELETLDRSPDIGQDVCLELKEVSVEKNGEVPIHAINLKLHHGEILGIAGVEGNGQSTLVNAIVGAVSVDKGDILLDGVSMKKCSIRERMDRGVAHIPEDRMTQGLALEKSVEKNLILGIHNQAPINHTAYLNWKEADRISSSLIDRFSIKTRNEKENVANLSGGNMQKVVVARELNRNPKLVVACQPTRGVDIGSSKYIRKCLLDVKENKGSVLLVSADLDEILELCDRIAVIYNGSISGILDISEATEMRLGELMFGKVAD